MTKQTRTILIIAFSFLQGCYFNADLKQHSSAVQPDDLNNEPSCEESPIEQTVNHSPVVLFEESKVTAKTLAVIYNILDPESAELANYYKNKRSIPQENIIGVSFNPGYNPSDRIMSREEFNRVYAEVVSQLPIGKPIYAFALAWSNAFLVAGQASITYAFALGVDPNTYCSTPLGQPCATFVFSPYFDTDLPLNKGVRPTMLIHAGSLELSKAMIDRGVEADNLNLMTSEAKGIGIYTADAVRSAPREDSFSLLKAKANYKEELKFEYLDYRSVEPDPRLTAPGYISFQSNLLFHFTGLTWVGGMESNHYLPGAIADHLTSSGGVLNQTDQMQITEWIKAGATASYGTVVEPYAITEKFPDPAIVIRRYMSGEPLIEAYWKSVSMALEGLFMGEPLSRPGKNTSNYSFSDGTLTITTNSVGLGRNWLLESAKKEGPYKVVKEFENEVIGKVSVEYAKAQLNHFYKLQLPMKVREVTTGISAVTSNIGVLPKAEVYYSAVQTLNWSFPKVVGFQIETTENLTCLLPTVTGKGENTYSITCTNCDDSLQKTKNYRFSEPLTTADSLEIRFPCYPDTGFDVNFLPGNFARNLSDFYWKHETIDTLDSFVYYSEIGRLNNLGEYSKSYDFNEDGVLNELDRNEMDKIVPYSTVSNRKLFYNRTSSTVFGDGSGNPISSIDKSKSAFFPGGKGNRLKYSNYTKGINGIIVDFSGKVGNISASDFEFEIWNGIDTIGFKPPNTIATVTKLPFGGYFTEHRVKIEFPDYAIKNTWLKVRIHAGENSGLKTDEVFYFGNIVGDVGNDPIDVLNVDDMDINLVSQNQSPSMNSVTITNTYDVNKDGRVNAIDLSSVKQNLGESVIKYFLAPLE